MAIFRGVLVAPEPKDSLDNDSDSDVNRDSASNSNGNSYSNNPSLIPIRPNR